MKNGGLDWAYKELGKKLLSRRKRQEPRSRVESGTLVLVNPHLRETIDHIIADLLWPAVLEGLDEEGIDVYRRDQALKSITGRYRPEITRDLVFLLEDPIRPIGPKRVPLVYQGHPGSRTS